MSSGNVRVKIIQLSNDMIHTDLSGERGVLGGGEELHGAHCPHVIRATVAHSVHRSRHKAQVT